MEITKEFKKVLIDWFSRLSLTAVIAFIITPFISDKYSIGLIVTGVVVAVLTLGVSLLFASTIKEEDENG